MTSSRPLCRRCPRLNGHPSSTRRLTKPVRHWKTLAMTTSVPGYGAARLELACRQMLLFAVLTCARNYAQCCFLEQLSTNSGVSLAVNGWPLSQAFLGIAVIVRSVVLAAYCDRREVVRWLPRGTRWRDLPGVGRAPDLVSPPPWAGRNGTTTAARATSNGQLAVRSPSWGRSVCSSLSLTSVRGSSSWCYLMDLLSQVRFANCS
mmetsp:Transcript_8998/g.25110  ORF Transcript_8998/g.25110 Transcript_8998/m.25110 type:complete len:205 (+) Transcript_8998:524-1138(+)